MAKTKHARTPRRSFPGARGNLAPANGGEQLLTAEAVADRLLIHRDTVFRWAMQGRIEYVRLGGSTRFRASTVERMIREGTVPANTDEER